MTLDRAPLSLLLNRCAQCSRIAGCELEPQQGGEKGLAALRETIDDLLRNGPVGRTHAVLERVAGGFIKEFPAFVDHVVAAIAHPVKNHLGHLAGVVSESLGKNLRTIEQICTDGHWPMPKDLLDWTVLLWLTSVAQLGGMTTSAAARQAGINRNRLRRIRHNVLPGVDFRRHLTPRAEFFLAVTSLTERCRGGS